MIQTEHVWNCRPIAFLALVQYQITSDISSFELVTGQRFSDSFVLVMIPGVGRKGGMVLERSDELLGVRRETYRASLQPSFLCVCLEE